MEKIITLTFSPCIDKSTSVKGLVPEKKLSCTSPVLEPGGGGINVARALKKLGSEAIAVFPSGGYTGQFFNHLLEKEGISSRIIESVNETRENIIVLDESTNNQYRFGMPGTTLNDTEWKKCLEIIAGEKEVAYIVASGSLPPGVPKDIYAQLARIAKLQNAKLVVDTSGEALRHASEEGVFLLKPNLSELASLAGKTEIDNAGIYEAAHKLISSGGCEAMLVSMGASGAVLFTKDIATLFTPPPVKRLSTVGAGDSMVAGMVCYLSRQINIEDAAAYAVACGSAATMNHGTQLCNKKDADNLFPQIHRIPFNKAVNL